MNSRTIMFALILHMQRFALVQRAEREALLAKHEHERLMLCSKQSATWAAFVEDLVEKTFPGFYTRKPNLKVVS